MASAGATAAATPTVMTESSTASSAVCAPGNSNCHHIYLRDRQQYITKCPSSSFLRCTLSSPRPADPQSAFLGDVLVREDEQHHLVESFLDFTRTVRGTQLHLLREERDGSDLQFVCSQNSSLVAVATSSPCDDGVSAEEEAAAVQGFPTTGPAAAAAATLPLGQAAALRGDAIAKQQQQQCQSDCSLPTALSPAPPATAAARGQCLRLYRIIEGGLLASAASGGSSSNSSGGDAAAAAAANSRESTQQLGGGEECMQKPAGSAAAAAGRAPPDPKSTTIAAATAKAECAAAVAAGASSWQGQLQALLQHVQQHLQQQQQGEEKEKTHLDSSGKTAQTGSNRRGSTGMQHNDRQHNDRQHNDRQQKDRQQKDRQQKDRQQKDRQQKDRQQNNEAGVRSAVAADSGCISTQRLLVAAPLLPLALDGTRVLLLEGVLRRSQQKENEGKGSGDQRHRSSVGRVETDAAAETKRDMLEDSCWMDSAAAAAERRRTAAPGDGSNSFSSLLHSERRRSSSSTSSHEQLLLQTASNTNTDESSSTRSDSSSTYWPEAEALTDLLHQYLYGGVWSCTVEAETEEETEKQHFFPLLLSSARIDASVMVLAADGEDAQGFYRRVSFFFHFRSTEDLICAVGSLAWSELAHALETLFGRKSMSVRIYKGIVHSRKEEAAAVSSRRFSSFRSSSGRRVSEASLPAAAAAAETAATAAAETAAAAEAAAAAARKKTGKQQIEEHDAAAAAGAAGAGAVAAGASAEVLAALREKHTPRRRQQQQQQETPHVQQQQQQETPHVQQQQEETVYQQQSLETNHMQQQQQHEGQGRVQEQQVVSTLQQREEKKFLQQQQQQQATEKTRQMVLPAAAAVQEKLAINEEEKSSSSSRLAREEVFDCTPLLKEDPKLAAVADHLQRRLLLLQHAVTAIENIYGSLSAFASGYKIFGFHRVEAPPGSRTEKSGWIYREWLPHASEVYLFGDFNEWNRESHALQQERRAAAPYFFDVDLQLQEAAAAAATLLGSGTGCSSNSSSSEMSVAALASLQCMLQQQQKRKSLSLAAAAGNDAAALSEDKQQHDKNSGVWSIFLPDQPDGTWLLQHKSRVRIRVVTAAEGQQRMDVDRVPAWIRVVWKGEDSKLFNGVIWMPPASERYEIRHTSPRRAAIAAEGADAGGSAAKRQGRSSSSSSINGSSSSSRTAGAAAAATSSPKIYEVHVGSSGKEAGDVGSYKHVKEFLLPRILRLGYNALLLNGVMEHADYGSFGFYVTNYFALSSRFGTIEEFKELVDAAHAAGVKVLLCLYHSHASSNALEGLGCIDGSSSSSAYFTKQQQHEWGAEAKLFDYQRTEVLRFLLSNLHFFRNEYHIDGFRFEGVTSMLYDHHGTGHRFEGEDYSVYFSSSLNTAAALYLSLSNLLLQQQQNCLSIASEWSGFPSLCRPVQHGGLGFCMRYTSLWGQQVRQQLQQRILRSCCSSSGCHSSSSNRDGSSCGSATTSASCSSSSSSTVPLAGEWNLSELVWPAAAQPNTEKVLRALEDADSTRVCQRPLLIALFSWESLHTHAVGGVAPHVTELAAGLSRLGCEVHVFVRATGMSACRREFFGVVYHECCFSLDSDFVVEMRNMCESFLHSMREVEEEKGEEFHVLHAHDWLAARAMISAKTQLGRVCVFTMHSTEFGRCGNNAYGGISKSIRDIEAEACHVADRVICVSGVLAAEVQQQYNVHPAKIKVIYNGIQCHKFDGEVDAGSVKAFYGIAALQPMFLFVGRLAVQKGPDLLLEAVPYVLRFRGDARFIFVGDGHMMTQLKQRARQLNVEHAVQFIGQSGGAALHALFKSCDAVVVPSRNEPFGIVVLEAWSSSKPVVATNSGGPRDFVNPAHTGYLVDPSPGSIAWGCCEILKNFEHSRWMGSRGRVTAAFSFSWDSIASQTRDVYYQQHCLHDASPNCAAARRGNCPLAFSLVGPAMYSHMSLADEDPRVLQGLALWRVLKLLLLPLSCGCCCFMGNEFAHPDGIDLPRPANNFSLTSNFRRWTLSDDINLKFHSCELFEACVSHWEEVLQCQTSQHLYVVRCSDEDQVVIIERGNCLFAINMHPLKSYEGYQVGCDFCSPLRLLLDTDEQRFGGFGRLMQSSRHPLLEAQHGRRHSIKLYLPSRTAALYAPEAFLDTIQKEILQKEILRYSPEQYVSSLDEMKRRVRAAAAAT